MDRDRIEGKAKEIKGTVKKEVAKQTGDNKAMLKGKADEMKGKAQQKIGKAKDEIRKRI